MNHPFKLWCFNHFQMVTIRYVDDKNCIFSQKFIKKETCWDHHTQMPWGSNNNNTNCLTSKGLDWQAWMTPKNIIQNLYLPSKSDKSIYCRVCLYLEKKILIHTTSNIDRGKFSDSFNSINPITKIHIYRKMVNLYFFT